MDHEFSQRQVKHFSDQWVLAQWRQRLPCSLPQWRVLLEKAIREIKYTLEHDDKMSAVDRAYNRDSMSAYERQREEQLAMNDRSVDFIRAPTNELEFQTWSEDYQLRLSDTCAIRLHTL